MQSKRKCKEVNIVKGIVKIHSAFNSYVTMGICKTNCSQFKLSDLISFYICEVKRWISSCLLLFFVISSTPLKELQKLPLLFEHFKLHVDCERNLGFIEFLKMHYFNGDPIDEDHNEDMKLPFKLVDHSFFALSFNITEIKDLEIELFFRCEEKRNIHSKDQFYNTRYLNAIWQPPKC